MSVGDKLYYTLGVTAYIGGDSLRESDPPAVWDGFLDAEAIALEGLRVYQCRACGKPFGRRHRPVGTGDLSCGCT